MPRRGRSDNQLRPRDRLLARRARAGPRCVPGSAGDLSTGGGLQGGALMNLPLSRNDILHWLCEDDPERLEDTLARRRRVPSTECRRLRSPARVDRNQQLLRSPLRLLRHSGRQLFHHPLPHDSAGDPRMRPSGYAARLRHGRASGGRRSRSVQRLGRPPDPSDKTRNGFGGHVKPGERSPEELATWREAGADRYLLRIETSNSALFRRIHPPRQDAGASTLSRADQLALMRELGYEIGSGSLIGIPGQSWHDLADDLMLYAQLDLDMIGVGPFIPHPETPLGSLPRSIESGWSGSQQRGCDLPGHGPGASPLSSGQYPQYDGARDG